MGSPSRASTAPGRRVEFAHGGAAPYDHLILATGARARALRAPGLDLAGVHALRAIRDAAAIKQGLGVARNVVVIGAGFIGLEIAATARALGCDVTIVEIADRPMGRAVSPAMSAFFLAAHRGFGARFELGVGVTALHGQGGRVAEVELSDARRLPADLVIVGVGVTAEDSARPGGRPRLRRRGRRRRGACLVRPGDLRHRRLLRAFPMRASQRNCGSNPCRTPPIRPDAWRAG